MKKHLLIFSLLFLSSSLLTTSAQTMGHLWGTVPSLGDSGGGVLFKYNSLTGTDSVVKPFYLEGINAAANVIQASDGNYYGITTGGGYQGNGTIYQYNPTSGTYKTIYMFKGGSTDGSSPAGGLIEVGQDTLYGLTADGGTHNKGVLFRCTLTGSENVLYSFGAANDANQPVGSLLKINDTLYGVSGQGGANTDGSIFKFDLANHTESVIHSFTGTDGQEPAIGLIQVNDTLYGTTAYGGTNNSGVLFKCNLSGTEVVLHNFGSGSDGTNPQSILVNAGNDTLYGTTNLGGTIGVGTVFKCNRISGTENAVYNFGPGAGGYQPCSYLYLAGNNTLYGTTQNGGANFDGVIFSCSLTGTETPIHPFGVASDDGIGPIGLFLASNDSLYGVTFAGGSIDYGVLFSCDLSGSHEHILHNFGTGNFGYQPTGHLIQATDGNFYGMTYTGGTLGFGTIYKISPQGSTTTLYSFQGGNDGEYPYGSLIQANDGNLYGMTYNGGSNGSGTLFKCSLAGNETVLHSFIGGSDGAQPYGSLIQASNDTLYGTTSGGGGNFFGTLFKCSLSGNEAVIWNFGAGNDGFSPAGSVIEVNDILYGLTESGGPSFRGTLFKCSFTGVESILYDFSGSPDGQDPYGDLILGSNGLLYGMTNTGGTNNNGTIFTCSLSGTEQVIHSFGSGSDGNSPLGSLIEASNDTLYGMTSAGGSSGVGQFFKCSLAGTESGILDFTNSTAFGDSPQRNDLLESMNLSIKDSTLTCTSQLLTAVATGGGAGGYSYKWSTGATTSRITVTTVGTYKVTVTNFAKTAAILDSVQASFVINTAVTQHNDSLIANQTGATSYQWLKCGSPDVVIPGATHQSYLVTSTGSYAVIINMGTCADTSSCKSVTVTGIDQLTNANGVSVYPIPSKGEFNISLSGMGYKSLTIYDEIGKEVYTQSLDDQSNDNQLHVDLSTHSTGFYYAQIVTTQGIINKKICIQK